MPASPSAAWSRARSAGARFSLSGRGADRLRAPGSRLEAPGSRRTYLWQPAVTDGGQPLWWVPTYKPKAQSPKPKAQSPKPAVGGPPSEPELAPAWRRGDNARG